MTHPPQPPRVVEARYQTYFDGAVARRVDVRLGDTLQIFERGAFLAAWALADVRRVAGAGPLRIRSLTRAGHPARALGDVLKRIARDEGPTPLDFLRDHPLTRDRQDRLENETAEATGEPLLTAADWLALRAICAR